MVNIFALQIMPEVRITMAIRWTIIGATETLFTQAVGKHQALIHFEGE
jgi:hypothetical protein